jgi:hypothetical protein
MSKTGDKIMYKSSLSGALLVAMLLTGMTFTAAPQMAFAQMESDQMFARQMSVRLQRMRSEIKRTEARVRAGNYENYGGISQQLGQLDESCRYYDRQMRNYGSSNIGTAYERQRRRDAIDYTVRGMEQRLRQLQRYVSQLDEERAEAAEKAAADEALEEELSEDDWAEEWAKGED